MLRMSISFILLSAVLTACGGGSSSGSPSDAERIEQAINANFSVINAGVSANYNNKTISCDAVVENDLGLDVCIKITPLGDQLRFQDVSSRDIDGIATLPELMVEKIDEVISTIKTHRFAPNFQQENQDLGDFTYPVTVNFPNQIISIADNEPLSGSCQIVEDSINTIRAEFDISFSGQTNVFNNDSYSSALIPTRYRIDCTYQYGDDASFGIYENTPFTFRIVSDSNNPPNIDGFEVFFDGVLMQEQAVRDVNGTLTVLAGQASDIEDDQLGLDVNYTHSAKVLGGADIALSLTPSNIFVIDISELGGSTIEVEALAVDQLGQSTKRSLQIDIDENDAPVYQSGLEMVSCEQGQLGISLPALSFVDPEGDELSYFYSLDADKDNKYDCAELGSYVLQATASDVHDKESVSPQSILSVSEANDAPVIAQGAFDDAICTVAFAPNCNASMVLPNCSDTEDASSALKVVYTVAGAASQEGLPGETIDIVTDGLLEVRAQCKDSKGKLSATLTAEAERLVDTDLAPTMYQTISSGHCNIAYEETSCDRHLVIPSCYKTGVSHTDIKVMLSLNGGNYFATESESFITLTLSEGEHTLDYYCTDGDYVSTTRSATLEGVNFFDSDTKDNVSVINEDVFVLRQNCDAAHEVCQDYVNLPVCSSLYAVSYHVSIEDKPTGHDSHVEDSPHNNLYAFIGPPSNPSAISVVSVFCETSEGAQSPIYEKEIFVF